MSNATLKKLRPFLFYLTLGTAAYGAPVIPAGKVEHEFIYDRIERQQTITGGLFDFQIGPYALNSTAFEIAPLFYLEPKDSQRLTLFGVAGENYTAAKHLSANSFESFRGGLTAQPFDKLFVYGNFVLDEERADNPLYSGKKWRGLAGDVEQAFAYYHTDKFNLKLGRFASFWGPRQSLVLGPDVALDGIAYSLKWGRLSLTYQISGLDGLNPDEDTVAQFENRFFAGHRLDLHLNKNLRLGFFETVIFGGPGRQIELYYLNPIIFFHGSQLNQGVDDNTFVGFDFDYLPRSGLRFYGQLMVDDFQIEKKSQGDREPNEIGLLLGTHWVDAFENCDIKASYTRVTNRTYNQGNQRNRYLHDGELLSSALGNDYDRWSLSFNRWLNQNLRAGINLSHLRQGEGRVTDFWNTPWLNVTGEYTEPFPTGTVEHSTRLSFTVSGFLGKNIFYDIESGVDEIRNYSNLANDNRTQPFVRLTLRTFFSGSFDID